MHGEGYTLSCFCRRARDGGLCRQLLQWLHGPQCHIPLILAPLLAPLLTTTPLQCHCLIKLPLLVPRRRHRNRELGEIVRSKVDSSLLAVPGVALDRDLGYDVAPSLPPHPAREPVILALYHLIYQLPTPHTPHTTTHSTTHSTQQQEESTPTEGRKGLGWGWG